MTEHAVIFAEPSLVGVLTDAETDAPARGPAVVFLNAGVLHRVGPNRLHVRMARELARRGFGSLRFDRSGFGDSPSRTDGLSLQAAALSDVRDALDFIAMQRGASSFILVGLCSGADLAFRFALTDQRVIGAVLIDGFPYRTVRSRLRDYASRLMRLSWRRLVARDGPVWWRLRRLDRPARPSATVRRRDVSSRREADVSSRREAEAGLRELTGRGVRLLVVFTHGRKYSYQRQFQHMFPSARLDQIDIAYFRDADHLYTLIADQDQLMRTVDEWMSGFQYIKDRQRDSLD